MENLKSMMKLSNCVMCQRELFDDDSLKLDLFYEFCCLDIIEHLKHIDRIYEMANVQNQLQQRQHQNGIHVSNSSIVTSSPITMHNPNILNPNHYPSNSKDCGHNNFRNFDITELQSEFRNLDVMELKSEKVRNSSILGSPLFSSSEFQLISEDDENSFVKSSNKLFPLANELNETLSTTDSLLPWFNFDEIGTQKPKLPAVPLKLWNSSSDLAVPDMNTKRNMFEYHDEKTTTENIQSLDYYLERRKRIFDVETKNDIDETENSDKSNYYRSLAVALASMRTNTKHDDDDNNDNYDNEDIYNNNNINNNNTSSDNCAESVESKLDHAARLHRASASVIQTSHKWSGILPRSDLSLQKIYSVKVFVGGLPWDIREKVLADAFRKFGHVTIDWPGKENAIPNPRGYAYVIFEDEERVRELLAETTRDPIDANRKFFMVPTIKKNIEIVPWPICDSIYPATTQTKPDCSNTVFVGALHGLLTAAHLAHIMTELFGETVFVGLDTDRNRYPIGSGRVIFKERAAFMKSIAAGYVEIKTNKFAKKIQIDPYLEEKLCSVCSVRPGIYFCRQVTCLDYYCRVCWENIHEKDFGEHQPIMRKFR